MVETLTLIKGSVVSVELVFLDDQDNAENLSECTEAVLMVKENPTDSVPVLGKDLMGGGLSVAEGGLTIVGNTIVFELTQEEADGLSPGRYMADVALLIDGNWKYSDVFWVDVKQGVSAHD